MCLSLGALYCHIGHRRHLSCALSCICHCNCDASSGLLPGQIVAGLHLVSLITIAMHGPLTWYHGLNTHMWHDILHLQQRGSGVAATPPPQNPGDTKCAPPAGLQPWTPQLT